MFSSLFSDEYMLDSEAITHQGPTMQIRSFTYTRRGGSYFIGAVILVGLGLLSLGLYVSSSGNPIRILEPLAAVPTTASSVGPTTTSSDVVMSQPSTARMLLNLPKLAFATFDEVGRVLGRPSRVTVDHNS